MCILPHMSGGGGGVCEMQGEERGEREEDSARAGGKEGVGGGG